MVSLAISDPPKVVALMVVKNELNRYLKESLSWLRSNDIETFILDDGSTDGTFEYCKDNANHVRGRHPSILSFEESESEFREAAWSWVAGVVGPSAWILSVDADEFPVVRLGSTVRGLKENLALEASYAEMSGKGAVNFPIPEVFDWEGGPLAGPMMRVDGYWGKVDGVRMARADVPREFFERQEGCGSVPRDAMLDFVQASRMEILHLGYLDPADRAAKFQRYSETAGHNPQHVRSILSRPTLEPWMGHGPRVLAERFGGISAN